METKTTQEEGKGKEREGREERDNTNNKGK